MPYKDRERQRAYVRRWKRTHSVKRNSTAQVADVRRWRQKNPEKFRAHTAVYRALKKGLLVKPESCEGCGTQGRLEGHHDDYSKPLEVRWLCRLCHARINPTPTAPAEEQAA